MAVPSDVVILSDFAHVAGGAEKVALLSARGLADRGVRVTLLSAIGPVDDSLVGVPGLEVVCLEQQPFFKSSNRVAALSRIFWNADARTAIENVLQDKDTATTVVHAHSYLKLLTSSTLDAALTKGFPTVLTLHDYGIACPTQSFYDNPSGTICTRKPLSAACCLRQCTTRSMATKAGLVARAVLQQRIKRLPQRITAYVSVSSFSHGVLAPYLPASTPVISVRNPVELERGERVPCETNTTFAFVGRLTPEKAPEQLAEAARLGGVPALFVGDGDQRAAIEAANPDAEITGWIDSSEVAGHTRRARALCVTSRWYEAAPLTVFDALSQGIPLIVADTCAASEFVEDGETGLLYEGGNVAALGQALEALQDDALVRRMSETAYERFWRNPPTVAAHLDELTAAYETVLGLQPNTPN